MSAYPELKLPLLPKCGPDGRPIFNNTVQVAQPTERPFRAIVYVPTPESSAIKSRERS